MTVLAQNVPKVCFKIGLLSYSNLRDGFKIDRVICASAKIIPTNRSIFAAMDTPTIHVRLTVEEVLQKWPGAFSVFMAAKTKCPGCFLQQFCTLKDVAETYRISLQDLIRDLEESVQSENHNQRSTL